MRHYKKLVGEEIYGNRKKNGFVVSMFSTTGFVGFYILYLLKDKPLYGEEIRKAIYTKTNGAWKPNPGYIYPILKEMRTEKLIQGEWDMSGIHPRHIYSITDKGIKHYEKFYSIIKIKFKEFKEIVKKIDEEVFNE